METRPCAKLDQLAPHAQANPKPNYNGPQRNRRTKTPRVSSALPGDTATENSIRCETGRAIKPAKRRVWSHSASLETHHRDLSGRSKRARTIREGGRAAPALGGAGSGEPDMLKTQVAAQALHAEGGNSRLSDAEGSTRVPSAAAWSCSPGSRTTTPRYDLYNTRNSVWTLGTAADASYTIGTHWPVD